MGIPADSDLPFDQTFVPTAHKGLTFPFGNDGPAPGALIEVAPGLCWARMPMPGPLRDVNCWLLEEADGVALVDTGFNLPETREAWGTIFAGPLAGKRVARVIGTHMHPDHIGLAGWFCAEHDAPLWMTRGEWLTLRVASSDAREDVPGEIIAFWHAAGWTEEQVAQARGRGWARFRRMVAPVPFDYRRLRDGDMLRIGARDWQVVVGSGHSPEHACLLDEAGGVLIAGDQVLPRISPNVSLGATEPEADPLGEWLASIAKLRQLPADVMVLPGHGAPFTGLHTRLAAMDREHRERLDELAAFLDEPRRAVDCFGRLFRRAIGPEVLGLATGEALAHLRRLEVEGRAIRHEERGVWWWRAA